MAQRQQGTPRATVAASAVAKPQKEVVYYASNDAGEVRQKQRQKQQRESLAMVAASAQKDAAKKRTKVALEEFQAATQRRQQQRKAIATATAVAAAAAAAASEAMVAATWVDEAAKRWPPVLRAAPEKRTNMAQQQQQQQKVQTVDVTADAARQEVAAKGRESMWYDKAATRMDRPWQPQNNVRATAAGTAALNTLQEKGQGVSKNTADARQKQQQLQLRLKALATTAAATAQHEKGAESAKYVELAARVIQYVMVQLIAATLQIATNVTLVVIGTVGMKGTSILLQLYAYCTCIRLKTHPTNLFTTIV